MVAQDHPDTSELLTEELTQAVKDFETIPHFAGASAALRPSVGARLTLSSQGITIRRSGALGRAARISFTEIANVTSPTTPRGSALLMELNRGRSFRCGPWSFNPRGGDRAKQAIVAAIGSIQTAR